MSFLVVYLLECICIWKISFLIAVSFIFAILIRKSESHRLIDQIPGPKCISIFGSLFLFLFKSHEDNFRTVIQLFERYRWSPLFRLCICNHAYVFVTKAVVVEKILNNSREINKSSFYKFLEPWLGSGLLTSNGTKWRKRRKLLTPSFHFGILEQFMPIFNEQSIVLVSKLNKQVGKGFFDVFPYISLCTLDIICETAMGTKIEAQLNSDTEYVTAIHELGKISFDQVAKPWLQIPWIFKLSSYKARQDRCLRILHSFTEGVIRERKKTFRREVQEESSNTVQGDASDCGVYGLKRRRAFLDTLLEAKDDDGIGLTESEIREEVDTFMFEGHDTTSVGIIWVLFCLGCHPDAQREVHNELDRVFGDDVKSVTVHDLKQLKYLEAVIREALRLFPSVPVFARTLTEDVDMGGYKVPKGTDVVICPQSIHVDPTFFEEPKKFDPSRFLREQQSRNPFAYIPFSAGPRNCIGQRFAVMEEKVVLSHILKNFKVSCFEQFNEIVKIDALVLLPAHGMHISVEKRLDLWVSED